MHTLVVRNLPDALQAQLKARAEANHRSVTKEVIALIEQALKAEPAPRRALPAPLKLKGGPLSAEAIEAAIEHGRA